MNQPNPTPDWITKGKTIRGLIDELKKFEDQDLEVKISLDHGETFKSISLVARQTEKEKFFCGLLNCEGSSEESDEFRQYGVYELNEDLNSTIQKGMNGTILEVLGEDEAYLMEFLNEEGTNYVHDGEFTFTVYPHQLNQLNQQVY